MKLQMIGTGAIGVKERSACSLIDEKILIDCGNGNIKTLAQQGVNVINIEVVFITHLHGDHFLDLPFLILQRTFNNPKKILKIYSPKGTEKMVEQIYDLCLVDKPLTYRNMKEKAKVEFYEFESIENDEFLEGYIANSYLMEHGDCRPVYGYIIKNKEKSIGFSGDTTYCDNINKIVENSTVSVLDMSFPERNFMHMGIDDIEIICNKFNKRIIATHMSEQSRKMAIEKNIANLIIPKDGDIFEI